MNLSLLRNYGWSNTRRDLLAGVTVAAISLPQAMAYALIAGVDPRFGLYSAIVVTLVASIFGSSSHLINGPTNAISLVVFSALAFFKPEARFDVYQGMFLLGIMVGGIQILIAVFKLGDLTRYISESVVLGFMAGAGFLVALGQVGNLFGLHDKGTGHQHVLYRFWLTVKSGGVNPHALEIGAGTIVLAIVLRKLTRQYPSSPVRYAHRIDCRRFYCRRLRMVAAGRCRENHALRGRQCTRPFAAAAYSGDSVRMDFSNVGQRSGHRLPGLA